MVIYARDITGLSAAETRAFNAKEAVITFLIWVITKNVTASLCNLVIGLCLVVINVAQGGEPLTREAIVEWQKTLLMPVNIASVLISTCIVFQMVRSYFPGDISSGAFTTLGIRSCRRNAYWYALIAAAVIFVLSIASSLVFPHVENTTKSSLLANVVVAGGWQLFALALHAILIAPVAEEFIFRGVLYSGLEKSWGTVRAALVVTTLFVAVHLLQTGLNWPALIGISLMAMGTVAMRIASGSLLPGMMLHAIYNAIIVIIMALREFVWVKI